MPPKSSQNVQNVQFSIFYILQESAGGSKFTAYFLSTIFVKKNCQNRPILAEVIECQKRHVGSTVYYGLNVIDILSWKVGPVNTAKSH